MCECVYCLGPALVLFDRNGTLVPEVDFQRVSSSSPLCPPLCPLFTTVLAERSQSVQLWSSSGIVQVFVEKSYESMIHHLGSRILAAYRTGMFLSVRFFVAAAVADPADVAICPGPFYLRSPVKVSLPLTVRLDLLDSERLVAVLKLGHGRFHFPLLNFATASVDWC